MKNMKFYLMLLIVVIVFGSSFALADGAPPYYPDAYSAIVSNKEGAMIYDWDLNPLNQKVDAGKIVLVGGIFENNSGKYIHMMDSEYSMGYLKLNDLSKYNEAVTPKDLGMLELEKEYISYVALPGCYLYSSPAENSKKVIDTEIPVGTLLKTSYYSQNYFTYTTYNGINGWVVSDGINNYYEVISKLATYYNRKILTLKENIKLLKYPVENSERLDLIIPTNTEFDAKYFYGVAQHGMTGYVMINVNGKSGWINIDDCLETLDKQSRKGILIKDLIVDGEILAKKCEPFEVSTNLYSLQPEDDGRGKAWFIKYKGKSFLLYPDYILETESERIEKVVIIATKNTKNELPLKEELDSWYGPGIERFVRYNGKYYEINNDYIYAVKNNEKTIYDVPEGMTVMLNGTCNGGNLVEDLRKGDYMLELYSLYYDNYKRIYCITSNGLCGWVGSNGVKRLYEIQNPESYIAVLKSSDFENIVKENVKKHFFFDETYKNIMYNENYDFEPEKIISLEAENKKNTSLIEDINNNEAHSGEILDQLSGDVNNQISGEENKNGSNILGEENNSGENENIIVSKYSPKQTIIMCVTGAIILAITALVIIKLINKSKENKN